jgi:DNA repair protein RecN (Recombination protein N)
MLCVKYMLADKMSLPTIIFDEIDTGISGEVAIKVSRMMQKMAQKHQVIVITHMPQIAAKGDTHFFVYKDHGSDRTVSSVKNLTENERLAEIAQMISGDAGSATALQHARELMGL